MKRFNTSFAPVFVLIVLLFTQVQAAYSAQVNETWVSGTSWSTGTWTPSLSPNYPNNGVNGNSYNVFFNNSTDNVILNVNVTIDNLTIAAGAQLTAQNGIALTLASGENRGVITNNGTIFMNSTGNFTDLISSATTLTGTGLLSMSNHANNRVLSGKNNASLTNDTDHTIQGSGAIGDVGKATTFNNLGLVRANQGTPLTLTAKVVNSGTLEANGGTLKLDNTTVTNNNGTIRGTGSSSVDMSGGTTVTGGILAGNTSNSHGAVTLNGIENQGIYDITNGTTTGINGVIVNNGDMRLSSTGTLTYLSIGDSDAATLTGSGTLSMGNHANNRILFGNNNASLTNDTNHTIKGSGTIGSAGHATNFYNNGIIIANNANDLILDGGVTNNGTFRTETGSTLKVNSLTNLSDNTLTGGTYVAAGTVRLPGQINTNAAGIVLDGTGSQLLIQNTSSSALAGFASNTASGSFSLVNGRDFTTAGEFTNSGIIDIGLDSVFQAGSAGISQYNQAGGATIVNGSLKASSVSMTGGMISGNGTIDSTVTGAGILSPGMSPGSLTITGGYNQESGGSLLIDLGGTEKGVSYDYLNILGNVYFGGSLEVVLWGSYVPQNGFSYNILGYDSISKEFDLSKIDLPAGWNWDVKYDDHNLTLTANAVPLPGALWLLGTGMALLSGIRRKRKD